MEHNVFRCVRPPRLMIGLVVMTALLSGCGNTTQQPPPEIINPPPTTDPTQPPTGTACAFTIQQDITVPTLAQNTTQACDYLIESSIYIKSTLTIEPGTVIRFGKDATLWVDGGEIMAVGNANARITLQGFSPIRGYWNGITFGTQAGETRLEYVDVMDAGQTCTISFCPQAAIRGYGGGQVTLKNSSVSNSYVNGAVLGDWLVAFSNNRFSNNRWYGLVIDADKVRLLDSASDYVGASTPNGNPHIGLITGSTVAQAATWKALNAPYRISGYIEIDDALTLEPSVTMLFGSSGEGRGANLNIEVGGALIAVGTAAAPITFTRAPGVQYWGGITFSPYNTGSETRFEHVRMSYGGDNDLVARAFIEVYEARVVVANSHFENSLGRAINCYEQDTPRLSLGTGNTFASNAAGDIDADCQP